MAEDITYIPLQMELLRSGRFILLCQSQTRERESARLFCWQFPVQDLPLNSKKQNQVKFLQMKRILNKAGR